MATCHLSTNLVSGKVRSTKVLVKATRLKPTLLTEPGEVEVTRLKLLLILTTLSDTSCMLSMKVKLCVCSLRAVQMLSSVATWELKSPDCPPPALAAPRSCCNSGAISQHYTYWLAEIVPEPEPVEPKLVIQLWQCDLTGTSCQGKVQWQEVERGLVRVEKIGTNVNLIHHTLWRGTSLLPKEAHRTQAYLTDLNLRIRRRMKEKVKERLWKGARKVVGKVTRLNPPQR